MNSLNFENLTAFLYRGEVDACRQFLDSVHAALRDDPVYLASRAELLRRSGDMEGSLAACLDFSRRFPNGDRHRYTMADVAAHLGQLDEAVTAIETMSSTFIPDIGAQIRAEAWQVMGRDAQVVALRPASKIKDPAGVITRTCVGQAVMRLDGIRGGIAEYADAWCVPATWEALGDMPASRTADFWHGQCQLPARLRVLRMRGGIGDYLLWARYLPLIEAQGVHVMPDANLETAMRPLPLEGGAEVAQFGRDLPPAPFEEMWTDPFALFTALFPVYGYVSRPRYYGPRPSTAADEIARSARAAAGSKPCMAIFWSANESPGNFALKSACLAQVLPLLDSQEVHWVVIQRGHQLKLWLEDPRHANTTTVRQPLSIDDTAALLAQLDGAVVVDTAVAHLSAALGLPTWLLASEAACWRYEKFGGPSPWYESLRIVRQPSLGDWTGAVANVMAAVNASGVTARETA